VNFSWSLDETSNISVLAYFLTSVTGTTQNETDKDFVLLQPIFYHSADLTYPVSVNKKRFSVNKREKHGFCIQVCNLKNTTREQFKGS